MNDLGIMHKAMPTLAERDKQLEELWALFANTPIDPDFNVLEDDFAFFPRATGVETVHKWFDERHSKGVAYLLTGDGVDRTPEIAELTYCRALCEECMSECCTFNPDGICLYPLVHGRKPVQSEHYGCYGCCSNDDLPSTGSSPLLRTRLEDLDFTARTYNCLKRAGFDTLGDIVAKNEDELLQIKNLGFRCLEEIQNKLNFFDLQLAAVAR